ncbi:hypothetical protein Pelo_5501 [Pelomyxa schiedti]|nr:hypothetical protein Pelo_5501 [Pelomyxa schiedti]
MHGHPVAEFVIMKETVRQLMSFPGEVYNTLHSLPEHSNDKGCTQLCTIVPALHTASMHLVPQIGSKMCKDHQNQVLDMVCTQDKCLICVHCSIYGAHAKHECILLKDAIASALNDLTDKDESISKLLVTAQAHHKQAEVIANMLQKSAVQSGQEAISILNKIVTTWHINVTELFSTTETQLTGALQQLAAFQKTIFALISSLNNMSSAVKALRKLGQFSLLSAITRISTIPPPASASASASQTTATTTTTTTTSSRSASAAPIIPPMPLAPETTTPSSPFVMRAAAERHSDADSAVAFLHAYALLRPKLAPPAAVPEPPAGLDRLASGFPRLTESEAVLQDAQAALAAKELELSESQAHHASLEAQLQAAQHETQAHRARIEELRGEIARLKGIDYGANDGTANLLNDPQTGGQCKVVQYAFTGGAGNYKSNCGGPSEAWCANGCLIDTQPTSRTTSTRAANSVGTTWTNNTASGIGILVVDIGRSAAVRTVVFFQMCSDGKTTRIKLSYHSKKGGAQAPQHDAPGWTDWGIGWADVADLNNSRDGGLTVDASNTWQVNFETQFLKIEVRNSGAYGNPSYIELRQLKAFSS